MDWVRKRGFEWKWKKTRNNFLFFVSTSSFIFLSEFPHPMWSLLTPCMSYNVWGLDELRPIFPQPSNGPGSIFCHSLSDLISRASVEMNLLCTAASLCTTALFPFNSGLQRHISQVIEIRIWNAALFNFLVFFSRFSSFFCKEFSEKNLKSFHSNIPFTPRLLYGSTNHDEIGKIQKFKIFQQKLNFTKFQSFATFSSN